MSQSAPEFSLEDTRGNTVHLKDHRGRTVILIFASQATQEASAVAANRLGKRLLTDPSIDMFTVVGVPKMFKMMAQGLLKQAQEKALAGARKRFEKEGAEPPANLEKRIYILPDWNGEQVKAYGFDPKDKKVHIAVVDGEGNLTNKISSADGAEAAEQVAQAVLN